MSSRQRKSLMALCGPVVIAGALLMPKHPPVASAVETLNISDAATPVAEPMDPRAYVRARASRHGWTLMQWRCAARLVQRESGWRVSAVNHSEGSSAYGLFQLLHTPKGTPLHKQVDRFFRYIDSRYAGDPCAALQHSLREGWY